MTYTWGELEGGRKRLLLTLTVRGQRYQFAAARQEIAHAGHTPSSLLFLPGLNSPREVLDEGASPGEAVTSQSIPCEVLFSGSQAGGWAAITGAEGEVDARAELAEWLEGTDFSTRTVILEGPVDGLRSGEAGKPVAFSLQYDQGEDSSTLLRASAKVDELTWPENGALIHDDGVYGELYPEVFGDPGYRNSSDPYPEHFGPPALLVRIDSVTEDNSANDAQVLLGNGVLSCVNGSATLYNRSAVPPAITSATIAPFATRDSLNQVCTVATVDVGTLPIAKGDELWWCPDALGRGGRPDLSRSRRSMSALPELLRYLLGRIVGRDVDPRAMDDVEAVLQGLRLDFIVNDDISAEDLLFDDILPLFPLSYERGRFIYWNWAANSRDVIAEIDTGRRGRLEGEVERSNGSDVRNEFRIDFAWDEALGTHLRSLTLGPTRLAGDWNTSTHPFAIASKHYHGHRIGDRIQTDLVEHPGTAAAILLHKLIYWSQTHRRASFVLPQAYQSLPVGAVVNVTHEPVNLVNAICLVKRVVRAPGDTLVSVETCTNWVRDANV